MLAIGTTLLQRAATRTGHGGAADLVKLGSRHTRSKAQQARAVVQDSNTLLP